METWVVLIIAAGLFLLLIRRVGSGMGCCGGGHSYGQSPESGKERSNRKLDL